MNTSPELSQSLTDSERQVLRTAAFGAVMLVSLAFPTPFATTKVNVVGAMVLTGATGLAGDALAGRGDPQLPAGTAAEIGRVVFPALAEAIALLQKRDETEVQNFRGVVIAAIEQGAAASYGGIKPSHAAMIEKIKETIGTQ